MQTATSALPDRDAAPAVRFTSILAVVEFDRSVPAVLSPASRSALRHAAAMVQPDGGKLAVLHVLPVEPRVFLYRDGAPREPSGTDARDHARLEHAIVAERIGVPYTVEIAHGLPIDAIVAAASSAQADVITIGYQDRTGAYPEGFSFRALLYRVNCPVLVTRATDGAGEGWEP